MEVSLSAPKPAAALKILVLRGGLIHKDKLVAALWPNEDLAVGRGRLRNVLSKIRRATGAQAFRSRPDFPTASHRGCRRPPATVRVRQRKALPGPWRRVQSGPDAPGWVMCGYPTRRDTGVCWDANAPR